MQKHLPQGTYCPTCKKKSYSKGYYCPFCGQKREKPNSQFIEYDFDLFPQNPKQTKNKQDLEETKHYVSKVVIAFGLFALMGAGFLIPYKLSERFATDKNTYVLELNLEESNRYKITNTSTTLKTKKSSNLFDNEVTKLIHTEFDLLVMGDIDLANINEFVKNYTENTSEEILNIPFDNILSGVSSATTVIIKDNNFVAFSKSNNLELAFAVESALKEKENFGARIINDYLIIANDKKFLQDQIDTYREINKSISKSGYFLDSINALPQEGQVFVFIKSKIGQEHFENTFGNSLPSSNLPIGIIINDNQMYYIDFTF